MERYDRTNQWSKPYEGHIKQADESLVISDRYGMRLLPGMLSPRWTGDYVSMGPRTAVSKASA